jgi:hypothetical protein
MPRVLATPEGRDSEARDQLLTVGVPYTGGTRTGPIATLREKGAPSDR